jgi:folate-binding protein YgfZ
MWHARTNVRRTIDGMATIEVAAGAYAALTEGSALVDRSERGKLGFAGPEAGVFLNGQVTNDVEALAPGEGCYAALLTNKGKMLGDLRVLATGDELLLDCERSALQGLFDVLRRAVVGWRVELRKRTVQEALFSLLGPGARATAGAEDLPEAEHAHRAGELAGASVRLVATDRGVDVFCEAGDAGAVRAALVGRGAVAVDEPAAEVVRVESGRPRYGVDLDDGVIPEEAGLNARAVSFTKGCYVGQETVARLHYKGKPNRHLRGLRLSRPVPPGTPLLLGDREVGRISSSVVSPRFGPIGLALVRRQAEPGTTLAAGDGADATADVVELPF